MDARRAVVFLKIVIAAFLALGLDLPVSRAMVQEHALRFLHHFLESMEPFGQPPAVIAVSLAILFCAGAHRALAFRIAAAALAPGLTIDVLKLCVARVRPRDFDFHGTVLDTFQGFFPGLKAGSSLQSWPSGHSAVAAGFALALAAAFPRGRWLFGALALFVMLQRVETGAHYVSDTLFASAIAYLYFMLLFGAGPVGRWFERLEARWGGASERTST